MGTRIGLMRFLRRSATVIGICGLALAALAAPVSAQVVGTARIHVPFAFKAGKVEMPAGDYTVRRTSGNILVVRNLDTAATASLATMPLDSNARAKHEALVFIRSSDETVLAEARWHEGTMTYRTLPPNSDARLAVIAVE